MLNPAYKMKLIAQLTRVKLCGLVLTHERHPYCYRCWQHGKRIPVKDPLQFAKDMWTNRHICTDESVTAGRIEPYVTVTGRDYEVCRYCYSKVDSWAWTPKSLLRPELVDAVVYVRYRFLAGIDHA